MALQGYEWDVMENTWIDSEGRNPMMNQAGINFVVTELNHIMNKFIPQSNLTSKQVENYILSYSSRVRTALVQNTERFKIKKIFRI